MCCRSDATKLTHNSQVGHKYCKWRCNSSCLQSVTAGYKPSMIAGVWKLFLMLNEEYQYTESRTPCEAGMWIFRTWQFTNEMYSIHISGNLYSPVSVEVVPVPLQLSPAPPLSSAQTVLYSCSALCSHTRRPCPTGWTSGFAVRQ